MILFKIAADLTKYLRTISENGGSIGFVPTLGALHPGHLGLVQASRQQHQLTVASIFVNPTQFNDPADFAKYPVTVENDIRLLEEAGCDVLFLPSVDGIYPGGMANLPQFDLGYLETILEGKYRPGHYQGVCQVMNRLLEIVMPATLLLGQKDYQQCMVIRKLISLNGWNIPVEMVPTVREDSGLAMSSRNTRLSETGRQQAAVIYRSLQYLQKEIRPGVPDIYINRAIAMIETTGFEKVDYVAIAHADTLQPIREWNGRDPLVALVAAFIEGVRLIDNLRLS
ncbi:MAG: pantoate--beta-alanine ligase [Sediminibacterium sp.]|nr:pantoate--beta-alanine ligase [Sediminibacterium sp.]